MLIMSAPKNLFIGHSLLYVGTTQAVDWPTSGNARCRPTPKFESVVIDGRKATPFSVGHFGVRGTLKGAGSRNQAGCLGGFQTVVRQHQSSQSLARTIRAGSTPRLNCRKWHAGASHATTKVSSAGGRALESSASNFPRLVYLNC